jgi:hypothetical protein
MSGFKEDGPKGILNRRDMLKILGATGLIIGAETTALGVFNVIDNNQREIYLSLLKFKAAEIYAWQKKWPMVELTAHHFISGQGELLKITGTLIDSLKISSKEKNINTQSLLNNFFAPFVSESINQGLPTSEKWSIENITSGKDFRFVGEVESAIPDINLSLHRFGVEVCGNATDPQKKDNGIRAIFQGTVKVKDLYDFGKDDKDIKGISFTNTAVVLMLREMGVENPSEFLSRRLGEKAAGEILNSDLGRFSTDDGRRLQDAGIGKPYEIVSEEIYINSPIVIAIPK